MGAANKKLIRVRSLSDHQQDDVNNSFPGRSIDLTKTKDKKKRKVQSEPSSPGRLIATTGLEGQWYLLVLNNNPQRRRTLTEFFMTDRGYLEQYIHGQLYARLHPSDSSNSLYVQLSTTPNRVIRYEIYPLDELVVVYGSHNDQLVVVLSKELLITVDRITEIDKLLRCHNYDTRLIGFDATTIINEK